MYSRSHTLVQSCWVCDCFPQQGYNLSISMDSAISTFRFPQVLRNKIRHQLICIYISIYLFVNVRIITMFACWFPYAPKQAIRFKNKPSFNSPELSQQFEVSTHNQDLVKTMGLGVTSLSCRHWGKGETWCESVKAEQWRELLPWSKSWGILTSHLRLFLFV